MRDQGTTVSVAEVGARQSGSAEHLTRTLKYTELDFSDYDDGCGTCGELSQFSENVFRHKRYATRCNILT